MLVSVQLKPVNAFVKVVQRCKVTNIPNKHKARLNSVCCSRDCVPQVCLAGKVLGDAVYDDGVETAAGPERRDIVRGAMRQSHSRFIRSLQSGQHPVLRFGRYVRCVVRADLRRAAAAQALDYHPGAEAYLHYGPRFKRTNALQRALQPLFHLNERDRVARVAVSPPGKLLVFHCGAVHVVVDLFPLLYHGICRLTIGGAGTAVLALASILARVKYD